MAPTLIHILSFVLLLFITTVVFSRAIDSNTIYSPEEFEEIQNTAAKKASYNEDKFEGYVDHQKYEIVDNAENFRILDRFLGDVACRRGFVKIGGSCIRSWD